MTSNDLGSEPRLLILASSNRRRGAEVFAGQLRDGLAKRGWVVEAVSLTSAQESARVDLEPLSLVTPDQLGKLRPSLVSALRARISAFKPDLVLANGGATLRYGALATRRQPTRFAYVAIGEPGYWLRSRLSRMINRFLLRRTDVVIAVSQCTADQLVDLEPSLKDRINVAHTGVPGRFLDVGQVVPVGPLRVVMIGSLSTEKDPVTGLRAVANIPGAILRFVGAGPLEATLRTQAVSLGLQHRLDLVGSVNDITPHLEWAHVLVLTSLSEGLPGVILEAGAAGVPTVSVDVGGVREAIVDDKTGMVVPRDVSSVSAALRDLDVDRDRLVRMGSAARRHVASNFGLNDAVDRYAAILEELAS